MSFVTQSHGSSIKGVLGKKLGMTQVFDANNKMIPVTVVEAGPCVVTQIRTPEVDGYSAVQIAFGAIDPKKVSKPQVGHFAKAGVTPRRSVAELRTLSASQYTVGQELGATVFEAGEIVDATGTSTGKGHAGVMKRHGFGAIDPKKISKPLAGQYAKSGVTPRRSIAELRTLSAADYTVGQEIGASTFAVGDIVDATGTSTGKGTAGVMKRHGFGGLGSSHGVDRKHRMPGSIGACSTPGRVFKGMRMMGRMGNEKVTTQNLTVQGVDLERNLLLIKGAVPGTDGGLVFIRSAAKKALVETVKAGM